MSQAGDGAAQPPLLGLASASLSSPFGILAEEVLPEKMAHVTLAPGAEKRVVDTHPSKGNKKVLKVMDKQGSNSKLTPGVPGKGILLSKPVPPPNTGDGKVTCLDEPPDGS